MRMGDVEIRERQDIRTAWTLCCHELRWMVRNCRRASSVLRAITAEATLAFNQAHRENQHHLDCMRAGIDAGRRYVQGRCEPTSSKTPAPTAADRPLAGYRSGYH